MRVLHVVPAVFGPDGNIGGAERYAVELVKALRRSADVRLVSFGDRAATVDVDGLRVDVLPGRRVRGHPFNRVSARIVAPFRWADVVHCHQQHIVSSSLLAMLGRLTGKPVVVTDHGGGGWDLSQYVSTDRLYAAHLHVSAFSRGQKGHASWRRAEVIYGGVDVARFRPAPWTGPRRRVLFVGRVLPHKGVHDLIAALADGPALDVIGPLSDAGYAQRLQELARGRDVVFHGAVDDRRLEQAYRDALCVVLPSSCRSDYHAFTPVPELLGQTLLEGMASGIPAICTDAGAMSEVVVDGRTGFVVPQNDPAAIHSALGRLAGDLRMAEAMGRHGRERVLERFSWDRVAEACLVRYRAVAARDGARWAIAPW
jgi:glycosyltransferase involved in cell wall biosynthesis